MTITVVLIIASLITVCMQAIRLGQLQARLTKTRTELDETNEELAAAQRLNKQLTSKPKISLKQADIQADISHPVPTVSTAQRIKERSQVVQEAIDYARNYRETPMRVLPGEIRFGEPNPSSPGFRAAARIDPICVGIPRAIVPDYMPEEPIMHVIHTTPGPAAWASEATREPTPSCHTEQSYDGPQSFCSDTVSYSDSSPTCSND